MKNPVILKDALANCSSRYIRDEDDARYGKGVLVGATAAIMALKGCGWADAYIIIKEHMPRDMAQGCIPENWG